MEASRDASIPLKLQYIRAYAEGDDFTEANFQHEQVPFDLEPKCVALVLVDVWNLGFGQRPLIPEVGFFGEYNGGKSFPARANEITLDKIKPALDAARDAGLTVVHLPSEAIARRYLQCQATLNPDDLEVASDNAEIFGRAERRREWPPEDFVRDWNQQRLDRTRDNHWLAAYARVKQVMDIADAVKPDDTDLVVATGEQMHRLLKDRGVYVLVYCGFAANWCLMDRPGALRDMAARGYGCILLRDATAAIEHSETVDRQLNAKAVVDQVELRFGYSALTDDFIRACKLHRGRSSKK
ncbi:MAG: cysteine hydrolase [Pirellulaceae bacterium]|nr:cysteine hydrolase [Pirellulaceae bacterium]